MSNLKEIHESAYTMIISMIEMVQLLDKQFLATFERNQTLETISGDVKFLWLANVEIMESAFALPEWNREYPYSYADEDREPTVEEELQVLAYRIDVIRYCINNSSLSQLICELGSFYRHVRMFTGEGDQIADTLKIRNLLTGMAHG